MLYLLDKLIQAMRGIDWDSLSQPMHKATDWQAGEAILSQSNGMSYTEAKP